MGPSAFLGQVGSFSKNSELRPRAWDRTLRRALPILQRASAKLTADLPLIEAALAKIDPTLSLCRVRARVLEVRDETHDVKTYVLRPNARFGSYRAGAYVTLELCIDGSSVQRSYSLSAAPAPDGRIAITVKRVPGGRVSNWLADTLRAGDVLSLSAPAGKFLLPRVLPERLLLISAGSGITPVMSMLRALITEPDHPPISFVHFAQSPRDVIFASELAEIAERHPDVHVSVCVEHADESWSGLRGRFSEPVIEAAAPTFRHDEIYLCGPGGFMKAVIQTLERCEADLGKLHYERFNADFDASTFLTQAQVLRFARSGVESISSKPRTILEEAERLGVPAIHGCRAGNCGTCRCTKLRGVVVDVVTGLSSQAGEELIYPCICVAQGTVEVDL